MVDKETLYDAVFYDMYCKSQLNISTYFILCCSPEKELVACYCSGHKTN